VPPDPSDDVLILAERLGLGIPVVGMDGEPIPLRDPDGRPYSPIDAALILLHSALAGLPAEAADPYLAASIERARMVEDEGLLAGLAGLAMDRRIAGVFVSAAVRADLVGRHGEVSPSDLNRATLAWFQVHHVRQAALLSTADWSVERTA
jgi:hypothetical protein